MMALTDGTRYAEISASVVIRAICEITIQPNIKGVGKY